MFDMFYLQAGGGGFDPSLLMIGAMLIVIWLFFLRPQAKKQKEQTKFLDGIEKGDKVVTSSGIIGRVNKLEGNVVTLETGKTFIVVTKGSISRELSETINKESNE